MDAGFWIQVSEGDEVCIVGDDDGRGEGGWVAEVDGEAVAAGFGDLFGGF